jgi:GNAT superfamily N-acetyltransferase
MDHAEVVRRTDQSYFDMWAAYGALVDGGEVREFDGVRCVWSSLPVAMFNNVFVTRALDDPRRTLSRAIAFFDELHAPFVVRIREGLDPAAEAACEALGLPYSDTVPGMALVPIRDRRTGSAPVSIERVCDEPALRHHIDVIVEAFDMPREVAERIINRRLLEALDSELYVGYEGGTPVATAGLFVSGRTAGIMNIACLASHRRRGIGEAMTWHAVARGAELGATLAALQASEIGRPVYERMGFELVSPYRTFVRPAFR